MRRAALALLALLSACAHDELALLPGEDGEAGAVAVLDPKSGREVGVVDKANSRAAVSARRVAVKEETGERLSARYGGVLGSLPEPPRRFVLYFREGSTALTAESRELLPSLFQEIMRRPGADIEIVGHTDTIGQQRDNDSLSLGRAREMAALLGGMGMDATITRTAGRGEREPRVPTADEVREPANRRVELFIR